MAVKRNAVELNNEYPQAAKAVIESFYVDDGLVGAGTIEEARNLQSLSSLSKVSPNLQNLSISKCLQAKKGNRLC